MSTPRIAAFALAAVALLSLAVARARGTARESFPALPAEPALAPIELLHVAPFALDEPFVHEWRAEKPLVSSGVVLVLRTAPELARPRQTAEPVLYVGDQTAERVNAPESSGILIVVVPDPVETGGAPGAPFDAAETPIWFGTPALPERVDAATIARERALARTQGAGPATLAERVLAGPAPGTIFAAAREDLDPYLGDLVERYAPEEADLAGMLRAPRSR